MNYIDSARFYVLAHMGGPGSEFVENSADAFANAVKLGCGYLETDVRLAGDGKLYLAHDATSWLPNRLLKANHHLLTLEALFDTYPEWYFSIDPKHAHAVKPLAELLVEKNMMARVCVGSSFDGRAREVADLVERMSGVRPATALVGAPANLALLLGAGSVLGGLRHRMQASFIHVHKRLISPAVIRNAHAQNLKVIAWVVNDKPTMLRFKELGVDGFMTNYPQLAKELGLFGPRASSDN
jgi:glycerophosphoryl diester phosphodiesterase